MENYIDYLGSVQNVQNIIQDINIQDLRNINLQNINIEDLRNMGLQDINLQNINPVQYQDPLLRFAACVSHLNGTCKLIADESSNIMKFIVEVTSTYPKVNVNSSIDKYLANYTIMIKHLTIAENYGVMVEYEPETHKKPLEGLVKNCIKLQEERIMLMQTEIREKSLHSL